MTVQRDRVAYDACSRDTNIHKAQYSIGGVDIGEYRNSITAIGYINSTWIYADVVVLNPVIPRLRTKPSVDVYPVPTVTTDNIVANQVCWFLDANAICTQNWA